MPMHEAQAAADVQRPNVFEVTESPAGQLEQDARFRLEEEVVLAPGERDRVLDLLFVRRAIPVERVGYRACSSTACVATDCSACAKPWVS